MSDDLAAPVANRRMQLAQASALDEMLSRVRGGKPAPAEPIAPAMQVPQVGNEATGSIGDAIVKVGNDVGKGVIESPRAIFKGVRDAYQNTINLGNEFGSWLEDNGMGGGVGVDKHGLHLLNHEEMKGAVRPADYAKLPDPVDAPQSVTGGIIKGTAQFLTGMKGAGKLADLAGMGKLAGAAGYGVSALKGAISNFTVFDPHQQRLSNLVEQFPALQNPVTDYLQSKPDDGQAEGRFKNSLEGLGLGLVTDGLFKGVKFLRSALQAKTATETAVPKLAPEELKSEVEGLMNPPPTKPGPNGAPVAVQAPLVLKANQDMAEKLTGAVTRTAPIAPDDIVTRMAAPLERIESSAAGRVMAPAQTFINFAKIDTSEDVQKAMQRLADVVPLNADTAKEGVRSFEDMKLDASHTNAWDALTARRMGEPLSDANMLAARQLWASSTDKLAQLAQEAAAEPSEANLFAFRKMLATHNVIQNEVLGARASIARAQASMRIPVGSSAERLKELHFTLQQHGGSDVARELAQAVDGMAKAGMISEMSTAAEKGALARTVDAAKEAWTLGLLTSPKTHLRNMLSNAAFLPMQMAERSVAAKFSSLLGDGNGVQVGEAAAQFNGMKQGTADMFRYYTQMVKARIGASDTPIDQVKLTNPIYATGVKDAGKIDLPPAISSEALKVPEDSWLGKGVNAVGSAYGVTTNALQAEDNFFKVLGYRMETHAQAFRQVQQEVATGMLKPGEEASRMADLISNPPENIRMASADNALYQTFNEAPGWFGEALLKLKQKSLVAHMLIPFARTTTNLMHAAFERTPLAPLVGQWRADLAAGGARRDLALARWSMGSMATFAVIDATMSGNITGRGPVDQGQRDAMTREGWRPYSVKVGDRWVSYNGLSPVGDVIGMAADMAEMAQHGHEQLVEGKDIEKVTLAATAAIAGNIMNKSYLSGLASAINATSDPQTNAASWARQFAASWVPSIVGAAEQAYDPNVRAVNSMMDAIRAKIPGMSSALPIRHDLWGDPMKNDSGYGRPFDVLSPLNTQKPTPEPIDQEILRLGANIEMPPTRVSFGASGDPSGFGAPSSDPGLRGAAVDLKKYPAAYERYVQLAGNELKHPAWGLGAKDLLNQIVEGKHPLSVVYNLRTDGPGGGKDEFIKGLVTQYRALARRQLLEEYPDVRKEAQARAANTQALKMPVMN